MRKDFLPAIIVSSLILHVIFGYLGVSVFPGMVFEYHEIHVGLEIVGAIIAIFVGYYLCVQEKSGIGTSFNLRIAAAMVGMGILDGAHSLVGPGKLFVWFHSLATMVGGILLSLIIIPVSSQKISKFKLVRMTAYFAVISVLLSVGFEASIPAMTDSFGRFTPAANFLNIGGGVLLLISGLFLLKTHLKTKNRDDLLFCLHCLLFGAAALMFQTSKLWDFSWWGWHILRFLAYAVAMYFVIMSIRSQQKFVTDKKLLKLAMTISDLGVWTNDINESKTIFDPRMKEIYGFDKDTEITPDLIRDCIHPDDREPIDKMVAESAETGQVKSFRYRVWSKEGYKTIDGSLSPFYNERES